MNYVLFLGITIRISLVLVNAFRNQKYQHGNSINQESAAMNMNLEVVVGMMSGIMIISLNM